MSRPTGRTLHGTEDGETLYGGPDWTDDRLYGRGGNDLLAGQWHSDKVFWRSDNKAPALRAVAGSRGPCWLSVGRCQACFRRVPVCATCSLAVSTAVRSCVRAFRAGCTARGRT